MRMCRYSQLNSPKVLTITFASLVLMCSQLFALGSHPSGSFSWHGFLSQGYVHTSHNNYLGDSTDGSLDFSEAGINAAWEPSSNLLLSGQLLYRRAGEAKPMGTRVDYAIADWRVHDAMDAGAGLRAGRLKNPLGFYSETRDVAATRPGIILPQGIYTDYQRELVHAMDSAGTYGHQSTAYGTFSLDINYGKPIFNDNTKQLILNGFDAQGELTNERLLLGRVSIEDHSGVWRTSVTGAKFNTDYEAGAGDFIGDGNVDVNLTMLSAEYNWNNWQIVSEYLWRNVHYNRIFGADITYRGIGYYLQLNYRITSRWLLYTRKEDSFLDKDDKDGDDFAAASGFTRPAHDAYAKDLVFGVRFQPNVQWTFGFEYHKVNGTFWLPLDENPNPAERQRKWEMFLFQTAYRF